MKTAPIILETFGSGRRWRAHHRKALQRARMAMDEAQRGCAHAPSYRDVVTAYRALDATIEKCRVKNWEGAEGKTASTTGESK